MTRNVTEAEMDTVFSILRHHVGKDNAINSQEINEALGYIDNIDSTPQTRAIIRALIHRRNIPIGSGNQGYWIIDNVAELESTLDQLKEREQKIHARRESLAAAVNKYGYGLEKMEATSL